jgi:predicted Holliday junction resolvase-like endonuclease
LAFEDVLVGVLAGLVVGLLLSYFALRSRASGLAFGQAQRIAAQMFETQKQEMESSFRETYEAKLGEWKATTLAQAIEENRADAVDTSRAVLKGKIAEQIAPLLPGSSPSTTPPMPGSLVLRLTISSSGTWARGRTRTTQLRLCSWM